jgi:hypothetical protein
MNPYIVLLATGEATIPFVFESSVPNPASALKAAAEVWRATPEGAKAEEQYLEWWNKPPMHRPIETVGWEAALALLPDDILERHGLKRVQAQHSTAEPGESVELSLVADPPRTIQVSEERLISA